MAKRKPPLSVKELKTLSWKDYVKTNHWKKFSKSLTDPENVVCDLCGRPRWNGVYVRGKNKGKRRRLRQFQCHHKNYDHVGEETREDVLVLCKTCHSTSHEIATLASACGGFWKQIYDKLKELTPWEYVPFKNKK